MKEIKTIEFKKYHYGPSSYFNIEIHKTEKKVALREWIDYDDNSYIILSYKDFDKLVELVNKERENERV